MTIVTTPPTNLEDPVLNATQAQDSPRVVPTLFLGMRASNVRDDAIPDDKDLQLKTVLLSAIRLDGGTQSRAAMDDAAIDEYTEAVKRGVTLPPLMLFFDGIDSWLADGFHRVHGYRAAGVTMVSALVRHGSRRDAVLYSVGANAAHGLRRSNADKRRSVETLLADDEWMKWSDREIARQCNVGAPFVADVRKAICNPVTDALAAGAEKHQDLRVARTVKRNGTEYIQHTQKIGKAVRKAAPCTPSTGASATNDFQRSNAKHAAPQENAAACETDPPPKALDELATCRKKLCAAQELIATLQIENAKLMQEIDTLNARLKAAESDRIDTAGDDAASCAASEE
jgi:hypothetical protein